MKNKLTRNTLRSLRRTMGRFISILAIIAIGCAFFSGIKSCSGYMKNASYKYLRELNAADFRIRSTLGFSEEDIKAIENVNGVSEIYKGYSADLFMTRKSENIIVSVYSYNSGNSINSLMLTEGRMPQNQRECVADCAPYRCGKFMVGDIISLSADTDTEISDILSNTEYTVVGLVRSPMYVAQERGMTTLGNGVVNGFIYVPESNFTYDTYTDIFVSGTGLSDINCFSDEYSESSENILSNLEAIKDSRIALRRNELQKEFDEDIADARAELADAEEQYNSGLKVYNTGVTQIETGRKELEKKRREFEDARREYEQGVEAFEKAQNDLLTLQNTCFEIDGIIEEYRESYVHTLPDPLVEKLKNIQSAYDAFEIEVNIRDLIAMYIITDPKTDSFGKNELRRNISSANEQVRSRTSHIAIEIQKSAEALNDAEQQIIDGEKQLKDGEKEILEGEHKLAESQTDLESARAEIDDGLKEIEDAENDFSTLMENGKWYVQDRDEAFPYYSSYADDTERVDSIAAVFPIFFIIISALVCVCTMTRMIEEQRTEIGTFKALGFSGGAIGAQYMLYAAAASLMGSTIGVCAGLPSIPRIIYITYKSMYNFPYLETPFRWDYYLGCLGVSLLCTAASAFYACRKNLAENPAQLMRPRPPRSGKRILLEKIPFIWKGLSFTFKVSFRNMLRYKSRFFMSVFGIMGCTALLLTGFALRHSISCIVDRQFGELFGYDAAAVIDTDADEEDISALISFIESNDNVSESMGTYQTVKDVYYGEKAFEDCYIFAPDDINKLSDFINLRERISGLKLYVPESGALVTEKLATVLGVSIGDEITVEDGGAPLRIIGIAENYVNNYIYINKETCLGLFGENGSNTVLMNLKDGYDPSALSEAILKHDAALAVTYTADGGQKFSDLINSMDLIVALIIGFSGALAFVVLFNLATINVNERIHELATLKVLGFYDGEVSSYLYRENLFSSIIGIIPGIPLGIALLKFVLKFAEVNSVMFGREIPEYCYGYAALATAVFSVFVNIVMHFRLKKIDMAASLKAIE